MSYRFVTGMEDVTRPYNLVENYSIAVGGHEALASMAADGIELECVVQLNAYDLDDDEDVVEDEVKYARNETIPRLRIDIQDLDDDDDVRTYIGNYFDRIVAFVTKRHAYTRKYVLFHCQAGVSRSTTAACA